MSLDEFQQALLARLEQHTAVLTRIAAALERGGASRAAQPYVSPATEVAVRYAHLIDAEPQQPGEVGVIYVGRYKVRQTLSGKLTLDLYAVGIQYEKFALFSISAAQWADPVLVPPEWKPEEFQDGTTALCRARVTYIVGETLKKSGNPYLNVLAVENMPEGVVLPPLAANALPYSERAAAPGQAAPASAPPVEDVQPPAPPTPDARRTPSQADQERALPPPPRAQPFDRGKALNYWLSKSGKLVAELKKRAGFADALAAAGFLADLEGEGAIERGEDAGEIVRKALEAVEKQRVA